MKRTLKRQPVIINNVKTFIDFDTTTFLEMHLEKNKSKVLDFKRVIDIGAFDCQESLRFTSLFPNAIVTAFECSSYNLPYCRENSKKSDRIILVEKMVTDTPSNKSFHRIAGGLSSMHPPKIYNADIVEVPTIRMDEYLDDSGIDLVWIDVQGAELNVLRSFGEKLKNVNIIYCEVDIDNTRYDSDSTLDTVSQFLINNGYLIKDIMILNLNEGHIILERT